MAETSNNLCRLVDFSDFNLIKTVSPDYSLTYIVFVKPESISLKINSNESVVLIGSISVLMCSVNDYHVVD
jgi:hypothetical protein